MSSRIYDNQSSMPSAPPRSPTFVEDTGNSARRTSSRSSLSDRLRNVFRRGSSSPNRTASNDRRPVPTTTTTTTTVRQIPPTPTSNRATTDAPQLRAPTISWPFGKKKNKSSTEANTPKASKKKTKATKQTNQTSMSTIEISTPMYPRDNQPTNQSEIFHRRTPETVRNPNGRLTTASSGYEGTTTRGVRDYAVFDQSGYSHQVVISNVDNYTHSAYTSDHSRSPSMNRQLYANTNIEQSYYHDNPRATGSIAIADVEMMPTPQQKRRAPDIPPAGDTRIITEKPPMFAGPPSTAVTNPTPWKSTSSSTLNNPDARSTRSSTKDVSTPKLNAPIVSLGAGSNKKKSKGTKSQTRTDGMSSSTSTINQLARQNPTRPNEAWRTTYGSLPDAEIMYGGSSTSLKPSKKKTDKYPGISAIVLHHMRRAPLSPISQNGRPYPTYTTQSPGRQPRFDTSTTTLNEYEENQSWLPPVRNGSTKSPSTRQRHDGYIRPMTPPPPPKSSNQPDVSVIRVDIDDRNSRSPPPPPQMYRSSTTVYTRDKHQYVDGGEIRTWSSHENNATNDYNSSYRSQPYIHVQVDFKRAQQTDDYDRQYVSSKTEDNFKEYRYSPRVHEEELYEREQKVVVEPEIHEEERYEVSYEYEQHHHQQQQQYSYESKSHYDQLHSTHRYTSDNDDDDHENLTYANLTSSSTARSAVLNEREKVYDHTSRTYSDSERIQELPYPAAPIHHSGAIPRTYTLKRSDSYDGLGISVSADSRTRSNHIIRDVEYGSPAQQVGLRKNDRIISINGTNVENIDFDDVLLLLKQGLDQNNLQLTVIHELDQI